MGIPLYTGIEDALEAHGKTRDKYLTKSKRRSTRRKEGKKSIEWSKNAAMTMTHTALHVKENQTRKRQRPKNESTQEINPAHVAPAHMHSRTSHEDGPSTSRSV